MTMKTMQANESLLLIDLLALLALKRLEKAGLDVNVEGNQFFYKCPGKSTA